MAATASESGWWQSFPDRLSWFRRSLLRRQEAPAGRASLRLAAGACGRRTHSCRRYLESKLCSISLGMSTSQFDPSQQKLVIFVAPATHSDEQNAI
jgi:hypothetical protein